MASSISHDMVLGYYPEALERAYRVPPVHFNRIPVEADKVPGTQQLGHKQLTSPLPATRSPGQQAATKPPKRRQQKGTVPPPASQHPPPSLPQLMLSETPPDKPKQVQESDLWDDAAQARIVGNLEELGKARGEVMFVISQFNLQGYLKKPLCQAATSQLPLPSQLKQNGVNFSQGDLDVLVIHRHYGILIGEAKSVGHERGDGAVVERVEKALKQLVRLEKVVRHLVSDITHPPTIRTTLFLPNVGRTHLQRILAAEPKVEQDTCRILGAATAEVAVKMCCCDDDLSPRESWWDVTPAVLSKLSMWWEERMDSKDPYITDEVYLDVVARFVGHLSTVSVYCCSPPRVEVRTEGEAVVELGLRLSRLVLTPDQWGLLSQHLPLVYLTGPPGTGKTVVMIMTALGWLQNNIDTHVVSTHPGTLAISLMIVEQLEKTAASSDGPGKVGKVHLHQYNFDDSDAVTKALQDLSTAAAGGAGIIMDEVNFNNKRDRGKNIYSLVDQLIAKEPRLRFWCAGLFRDGKPPAALKEHDLRIPLRSAPVVVREVQPALERNTAGIWSYSDNGVPAPGDGQRVRHLRHEGSAHTGDWPVDCPQCGKDVAAELHKLGAGVPGGGITYRDIFILTRSSELHDEEQNGGVVTSEASGFVRGVREAGMPVCALGEREFRTDRARWERELKDVATAVTDRITASHLRFVYGLERAVVVWLHGRRQGDDDPRKEEAIADSDRLHLVTRCTTQLLNVDVPRPQ